MENLLSPAVNRCDLRSLNYNKTIFGRTRLGELTTPSQTPESDEDGNTSSPFPLSIKLPFIDNGKSTNYVIVII